YASAGASIESIKVQDATGTEIKGFRYVSGTGLSYNFVDSAPVPEPATWSLTRGGAIAVLLIARRKRVQNR
ncbi:MAG TPA: PEP-CTERM sorting domain-containing protein, partial [Bryobacteraceae bacterium]|nr:PEP-CTERM sorting domain-containing protein [Bryobacteraceae bacterium]